MKKHWKVGLGFGVCFVMIVSVIFGFIKYNPLKMVKQNDEQKAAPVALTNFDGKEISYNTDYDYIVVEIVPDISYAQLGYLMEGQEPIDVMKACADGKADDLVSMLPDGTYKEVDTINNSQYEDLKDIYGESAMKEYWEVASGTAVGVRKTQYALKTGQKFVINQNLLTKKFSAAMEEKNVEDLTLITLTSSQLNAAELGGTDSNDKRLNTVTNLMKNADVVIFNQTYLKGSVNQTAFTQYMNNATEGNNFAKADLDFSVVQTIFKQVGNKKNPTPILLDSSIYDVVDASNETITTYQYRLSRENKYENNKIKNDFTVYGSGGLFNITNHKAGLDVKASDNNTYKLFLMSVFRDPAEFYNLFVESGLIASDGSNDLQKEKVSSDRLKYWNIYSFLPSKGDLASEASKTGDDRFAKADFDYWTKQMAILLEYNNKNYRNCNVLTFDAGTSLVDRLDSTSSYSIINAKNTSNPSSEEYTLAQEIATLMTYEPKSCDTKKTYKVLDIEPALSTKKYSLDVTTIERLIPYSSYSKKDTLNLKITRMTTAEFIGKIDDLTSTYDLIYIGDDISGMNLNAAGNGTIYTYEASEDTIKDNINWAKNGVIYSHVGGAIQFAWDTVTKENNDSIHAKYGFSSDTDNSKKTKANGVALYAQNTGVNRLDQYGRAKWGNLHYSGNDITSLKRTALEEYLSANLPVIVAADLYTDSANSAPKYFDSKDLIYNNMYQFLHKDENRNRLIGLDFNYRTASQIEIDNKTARLTVNKPVLTVDSISYQKNDGTTDTVTGDELKSNFVYEVNSASNNRKLTFHYSIRDVDNPNAAYVLEFYVDKNADGRYVDGERILAKNVVVAEGGNSFSLSMNSKYSGPFSWKVVIKPKNNPYLKVSQVGYGTIRFANLGPAGKKPVKVLQVMARGLNDSNFHSTSWGWQKAQQVNLKKDSEFTTLFSQLEDFTITVDTVELQNFNNYSLENMKQYDMIIFGFADSYRDLDLKETCAGYVEDYIAAGYSVLFTHDLTSQINDDSILKKDASVYKMETTNGGAFNKYLRDAMGLNRFKQQVSTKTVSGNNYDHTNTEEVFGFTYTTLLQYSNFRYSWKSPDNSKIGYLGPYRNLRVNFYSDNPGFPDIRQTENAAYEDHYATQYITNVNDGQITKYPFNLSLETSDITTKQNRQGVNESRYKIARTHGQYYQVNMEDPEIVCWYALSDGAVSSSDSNQWDSTGWYSTSPNDVANNYYIYNKGNVTYSGVGHSKTNEMSTFERKLFVNTMIAALRAGIEGPEVTITNGDNIPDGNEDRYVVMADVDVDSDDSEFAQTEDVKFYVTDDSAKAGDHLYVTLEVYNGTTWEAVTDKKNNGEYVYKVYDESNNELTGDTYRHGFEYKYQDSSGNQQKEQLNVLVLQRSKNDMTANSQHIYTIKYPREILKTQNLQNFRITVYNSEQATSYTLGAVMRQSLFPLD